MNWWERSWSSFGYHANFGINFVRQAKKIGGYEGRKGEKKKSIECSVVLRNVQNVHIEHSIGRWVDDTLHLKEISILASPFAYLIIFKGAR